MGLWIWITFFFWYALYTEPFQVLEHVKNPFGNPFSEGSKYGEIPIDRGSDRPIFEKGPLDRGSDRPIFEKGPLDRF